MTARRTRPARPWRSGMQGCDVNAPTALAPRRARQVRGCGGRRRRWAQRAAEGDSPPAAAAPARHRQDADHDGGRRKSCLVSAA
jgi:hypothetical protein